MNKAPASAQLPNKPPISNYRSNDVPTLNHHNPNNRPTNANANPNLCESVYDVWCKSRKQSWQIHIWPTFFDGNVKTKRRRKVAGIRKLRSGKTAITRGGELFRDRQSKVDLLSLNRHSC